MGLKEVNAECLISMYYLHYRNILFDRRCCWHNIYLVQLGHSVFLHVMKQTRDKSVHLGYSM